MAFRNQFLLTPKPNHKSLKWKNYKIDNYNLYTHTELEVNIAENSGTKLILLGYLFDYENINFSNQEIIKTIAEKSDSIDDVLKSSYKYSGDFTIIYFNKKDEKIIIFNDATSQNEIYYMKVSKEEMILGSLPSLINLVVPLKKDKSKEAKEFYNSTSFKKSSKFVYNATNYIGLKHLTPNHYIDIAKKEVIRFFPIKKLGKISLEEGTKKVAKMLKGYICAAFQRQKTLCIPVTAGWDSRVLLAASKDIKHKVNYFVKKNEDYSDKHLDIKTPKKLFKLLKIPFNVIEPDYKSISEEDLKALNKEINYSRAINFICSNKKLRETYQEEFLLLNGNVSEIGRMYFDKIKKITPQKIAVLEEYSGAEYAINHYSKWLLKNDKLFSQLNYQTIDMLYWEENCCNQLIRVKTISKLLGVQMFSPFNSRELLDTLLSIDEKYRSKQNNILYAKIIKSLWEDVLQVPINFNFKKTVIRLLQKIGVYGIYANLKQNIKILIYNLFKLEY